MANQNLSQFGENTSVSDADYTFVWDSAASISKKVSRNSWLNSGTLTSDAPVTISQTWNNAAVAFTGLKVNAAGTSDANSASGSLLADFQVNAVSKASVNKNGLVSVPDSAGTGGFVFRPGNTGSGGIGYLSGGGYGVWAGAGAAIGFSTGAALIGNIQTALYTDGAGQLALRNGAAAQTFRVYRSYLNAGVDYERLSFSHDGTQFSIGSERGGSGVAQSLRIYGPSNANLDFANGVSFRNATGSTNFMNISSAGNVGIGTTAPIGPLDVRGANSVTTGVQIGGTSAGVGNFITLHGAATNGGASQIYANYNITDGPLILGTYVNRSNQLCLAVSGNVGIGTTSPSSKLQVSAGDVEVDTIAKGVILKSPDGTRYRVTVANGGTLSVAAV